MDAMYSEQETNIDACTSGVEENTSTPLIGALANPSELAQEYANADRVGFSMGITWLGENYSGIRRVCGDGNCFYRSFLFAYLEILLRGNKSENAYFYQEERVRMLSIITDSKDFVVSQGYDEFVIETFHDTIVELLENLFTYTEESLLAAFQDNMMSNTCTWYMRILTASSLKLHADHFLPFVEDIVMYNNDIGDYCAKEVEPMGKECEQVQIMALLEVLHGVDICIEYLDGRPFIDHPPHVTLRSSIPPNDTAGSPSRITVTLLYRPGHYDILYRGNL